jgi:hypothetical protein
MVDVIQVWVRGGDGDGCGLWIRQYLQHETTHTQRRRFIALHAAGKMIGQKSTVDVIVDVRLMKVHSVSRPDGNCD